MKVSDVYFYLGFSMLIPIFLTEFPLCGILWLFQLGFLVIYIILSERGE